MDRSDNDPDRIKAELRLQSQLFAADPRDVPQARQDTDGAVEHLKASSLALTACMHDLLAAPGVDTCDRLREQLAALDAAVRRLRVKLAQERGV